MENLADRARGAIDATEHRRRAPWPGRRWPVMRRFDAWESDFRPPTHRDTLRNLFDERAPHVLGR